MILPDGQVAAAARGADLDRPFGDHGAFGVQAHDPPAQVDGVDGAVGRHGHVHRLIECACGCHVPPIRIGPDWPCGVSCATCPPPVLPTQTLPSGAEGDAAGVGGQPGALPQRLTVGVEFLHIAIAGIQRGHMAVGLTARSASRLNSPGAEAWVAAPHCACTLPSAPRRTTRWLALSPTKMRPC